MFTKNTEGYKGANNFAKSYINSRMKRVGVSRKYIYDLIQKEVDEPNSTDIDVLEVDGKYFCRHRLSSQ